MPPKFARMPESSDFAGSQEAERRGLLDGNSDDEDFFLRGPKVNTDRLRSDPKMSQLQSQVDDVVDIMKSNVNKVIERGDRLEDLQDKSESLSSNSDMFRTRAKTLQRSMWWKNCRVCQDRMKAPEEIIPLMWDAVLDENHPCLHICSRHCHNHHYVDILEHAPTATVALRRQQLILNELFWWFISLTTHLKDGSEGKEQKERTTV